MPKNNQTTITPPEKKKTLKAFFDYYELSSLLFDRSRDEVYNVTDIPEENKFYKVAENKAKQMDIPWNKLSHEDSNRIMLAILEDAFNNMRDAENSKNIILHLKIEVK